MSARPGLGLLLSLCTALLWGVLPVALKGLVQRLDPLTVTWARFVFAGAALALWLGRAGRLPDLRRLRGPVVPLILVAALGLVGNYVCYLLSVRHISPAGAQVLIQLAPLLLLLGGVVIFREPFSRLQWAGAALLAAGLGLFFNARFAHLREAPGFLVGVLWMLVASVTWAAYAMAQKRLLRSYSSPEVLLLLYVIAALLLAPTASPAALLHLDRVGLYMLLFACANTVLAYGAFAEALAHWEASRVSATLAITPLITIALSLALQALWPGSVVLEPLNALSGLGALLVVSGSALTALGRGR